MTNPTFSSNPRLVGYRLTEASYGYVARALGLGAVDGPRGDKKVTPDVATLLQAINAVLAGGKVKVEIEIESRGNPDIFNELNRRLEAAAKDGNAINKAAGYYVTAIP
jgi:hypothetical protein